MNLFLAFAALLVERSNAQQLPTTQRRLRVLSTANSIRSDSTSMSFIGIHDSAQVSGSGVEASKSGKASKSMKARSLSGDYTTVDTEDGSVQRLSIFCNEGVCDVTLADARFSTCEKIVRTTNGGVGIAEGIPQGSIGDFTIGLYCLEQDEKEIDFSKGPTTTLQGDIEILPDGGLRRKGPGFFYAKTTVPDIKDVTDEVVNVNDKSVNINGRYQGIDFEDGSTQALDIVCTKKSCDIDLSDFSFSTCKALVGQSFFQGVGVAKNVPRDSLDKFDIELYCLKKDERDIDYDREPDQILTGDLALVRDGILRRTGPGFRYAKTAPTENEEGFSVYKDFTQRLFGSDTEDGSIQSIGLVCKEGLCDIELGDSSFGTCIENIPGDIYLGGLATARGVPQDSLHDFELELFCSSGGPEGIDYTTPVAQLKGNLVFLQDGIVQRTALGFKYFNGFRGGARALTTGSNFYEGFRYDTGGEKDIRMLCQNGMCEVIIWSSIHPSCIGPSGGRAFLNGVAFNSAVPEESLEDFEIGLFCVPPGDGAEIDYETQNPITTLKASITSGDQSGTVHLIEDDVVYDLYKLSAD